MQNKFKNDFESQRKETILMKSFIRVFKIRFTYSNKMYLQFRTFIEAWQHFFVTKLLFKI